MPHIDITMIPGRDKKAKTELALKVRRFIPDDLNINDKFVSVSIEDVPKEDWAKHMESLSDKVMFVKPGI